MCIITMDGAQTAHIRSSPKLLFPAMAYMRANMETGGKYGELKINFNRKGYSGERLHFKFFDVELKKKGTIHIWFNDLELLKRWNVFAGMKKNYIPPEYGRKTYHEMSDREREVVNAFEGKAEYEKTMQNPRFYIGGATLMALTSGK